MFYQNIVRGALAVLTCSLFFGGCAKEQLVLKSYNPPSKQAQVKEMIEKSKSSKEKGYLSLEIFDDINTIVSKKDVSEKDLAVSLISNLKKLINQTNFISLSEIADESSVALDMKIEKLEYSEGSDSLTVFAEVVFNIRKSSQLFYTQKYQFQTQRQSRAGRQGLPTKAEILQEAAEYLATKVIKDISPLETRRIVELQDLPKEIAFTIEYAKAGNFKGAIQAMEKFQGKKEFEYHYILAVYYEALASISNDLALFAKADENYNKAMATGGSSEESVVKGRARFENFYEIIQKVAEQKLANKQQTSKSQYELLD